MHALRYIPNYSISDYLSWEGSWELWNGIPVAMSPSPFGLHQWVATRLATSINRQMDDQKCNDCFVLMEVDWHVDHHTVVRPDVSVCCGDFPERFIESAPSLIIEVLSESTADKDRNYKRDLYNFHGVKDYLIVDLNMQRFEHYHRAENGFEPLIRCEQVKIELHAGCNVVLEVPRRRGGSWQK